MNAGVFRNFWSYADALSVVSRPSPRVSRVPYSPPLNHATPSPGCSTHSRSQQEPLRTGKQRVESVGPLFGDIGGRRSKQCATDRCSDTAAHDTRLRAGTLSNGFRGLGWIKGKADAYSTHIPTLQRPTTLHYTSPHPLLASSLTHISLPFIRLTSNPGLISRFLSFTLSATQTSTTQRSL
ncbi:unnamed protein product [Hymenolepis diminuta]|uniref:Uncharacterized protein n=1 Tax=Hymenolepis diminuta TaxID=6216 RepID=A0A0R3SDA9_HYMDI|nr:unnamed protein product [Hymenolepis diminuta]